MDPQMLKDIETILKLLNLADEGKNDKANERDVAFRKAQKLMEKWGLQDADVYRHGKMTGAAPDIFVTIIVELRGVRKDKLEHLLAHYVAEAFDGQAIGGYEDGKPCVRIYATKLEAEIIVFIFKRLRRSVSKMADLYMKNNPYLRRIEKDSYRLGLIRTLGARLKALYKAREEGMDSECRALIVVKKGDINKYIKKDLGGGSIRQTGVSIHGSKESYERGRADGHNVNIAGPGEAKAPPQRIAQS